MRDVSGAAGRTTARALRAPAAAAAPARGRAARAEPVRRRRKRSAAHPGRFRSGGFGGGVSGGKGGGGLDGLLPILAVMREQVDGGVAQLRRRVTYTEQPIARRRARRVRAVEEVAVCDGAAARRQRIAQAEPAAAGVRVEPRVGGRLGQVAAGRAPPAASASPCGVRRSTISAIASTLAVGVAAAPAGWCQAPPQTLAVSMSESRPAARPSSTSSASATSVTARAHGGPRVTAAGGASGDPRQRHSGGYTAPSATRWSHERSLPLARRGTVAAKRSHPRTHRREAVPPAQAPGLAPAARANRTTSDSHSGPSNLSSRLSSCAFEAAASVRPAA